MKSKFIVTGIDNIFDWNFVIKHFNLEPPTKEQWNLAIDIIVVNDGRWFGTNSIHLMYNNEYSNFEIIDINKLRNENNN